MNKLSSMRYAGRVNQQAIEWGFHIAKPGVTLKQIDLEIENYILQAGCKPAFKGYQPTGATCPFPSTACLSPNAVVVHGIANDYRLENGDLLTIDVGCEYEGYFVDSARSRVIVSHITSLFIENKIERASYLVSATEDILNAQLSIVHDGTNFLELIEVSEKAASLHNVTIMGQWGGHQIGKQIHMPPFIPSGFDHTLSPLRRKMEGVNFQNQTLKAGQTICIEPVVTYGSADIIIDTDTWTVRKKDGLLAAHTERCLLVTNQGYEILS